MIKEVTIREGSTDYIDFQLFAGKKPVDLTGNSQIDLILVDSYGSIKKFSVGDLKLFITDQVSGQIQLRPAANDFYHARSPYKGYFLVHYSPTKRGAFPEDGMLIFNIAKALAYPVTLELKMGARFV